MANRLQTVVLQAIKTFNASRSGHSVIDDASFQRLTAAVNQITFLDIHLPSRLLQRNTGSIDPIEHLSVYEDENITVGVFIMKEGAKIPLHDHPGMHGILKVLRGTLQITNYNIVNVPEFESSRNSMYYTRPVDVTKNEVLIIGDKDDCTVLTPMMSNIHEVLCLSGPAAFLDILAPPYDDDQRASVPRSCHYFQEKEESRDGLVRLVQIPCPGMYWSEQDV